MLLTLGADCQSAGANRGVVAGCVTEFLARCSASDLKVVVEAAPSSNDGDEEVSVSTKR